MATAQRRRMRLGELLVAAGVLDETRLNAALAEQRKWGGKLGNILVDMKFLSEDLMVKALSRQLGIPRIDLDKESLPEQVTGLLGVDLCERYGVFPVGQDTERRVIRVATADPTNYQALDAVAFRSNLKVEPVVSAATAIDRAIRRYYYGESTVASDVLDPTRYGLGSENTYDMDSGEAPPVESAPNGSDQAPPPSGNDASGSTSETLEAIQRLDKTMSAQVRALRGLVELLVEQGVIDREAYLAKVRR